MRQQLFIFLTIAVLPAACTKAESLSSGSGASEATSTVAARPAPRAVDPTPKTPEPAVEAQVANAPQGAPSGHEVMRGDAPTADAVCRFVDPQFFGMLPAKWEGPCQDGKAHGRGILRSYDGKKVAATFFGTMDQGHPKLGVVEDRDGLLIGRFALGGTPVESDEFKDRLDAVNEAVAAAKQASEAFQKAGNKASAALYAKKAKMLDKQVE